MKNNQVKPAIFSGLHTKNEFEVISPERHDSNFQKIMPERLKIILSTQYENPGENSR